MTGLEGRDLAPQRIQKRDFPCAGIAPRHGSCPWSQHSRWAAGGAPAACPLLNQAEHNFPFPCTGRYRDLAVLWEQRALSASSSLSTLFDVYTGPGPVVFDVPLLPGRSGGPCPAALAIWESGSTWGE